MTIRPDDLCPRPDRLTPPTTWPLSPPLYASSVYACRDAEQAESVLAGGNGYAYQRDGHPNADLLADKCRQLHAAQHAAVTSSGMAAMSLALLSQVQAGDHVLLSSRLYGRTAQLLTSEAARLGITSTVADFCDLADCRAALTPATRLLVVETLSNPLLRMADIAALAELAHPAGALLLVDNTFATPVLCRPLEWGADLVLESITKLMNGHSDVLLGLLCGPQRLWSRVPLTLSAWGLASSPFDCWLALRGLATLALRVERAASTALRAAEMLAADRRVERVDYPGLPAHPDHALATRQLTGGFGSILAFHLPGGRAAVDRFIEAASRIPFCPSLGEVCTTLSHPASTSHRGLVPEERARLGIGEGTIRLSVGCESPEYVLDALQEALSAI